MHDVRFALAGAIVLAFGLAAIVVSLARSALHRAIDTLEIAGRDNRDAVHARARQLVNALTLLAYGVAAVASVSFTLAGVATVTRPAPTRSAALAARAAAPVLPTDPAMRPTCP